MLRQVLLAALAASTAVAVPLIEARGNEFVNSKTGNRFTIVGVAYQPGGEAGYKPQSGKDPLSHADACLRDAALMQAMGVNTIRVYNLDPNINHDECASIFNVAGIYLIIDVNSPLVGESLTANQPWASYYAAYLNHTFAIVEAFSQYPNTLLFFSSNENIRAPPTTSEVPPYVRAVTRDIKTYIKKNLKRQIPVGYSAADVRDWVLDQWAYLGCAEDGKADDMSRSDLFALNSYSWCGKDATFKSSGYADLTQAFTASTVPVFFSEYGCNDDPPRLWNDTVALYGDDMSRVLSGGIAYQWTMETNKYDLVDVQDDVTNILGDYNRLRSRWAQIDWKALQSRPASGKELSPPECKSDLIHGKEFARNFTAPALPPGAQEIIDGGVKPKPVGKLVKIADLNVKLAIKDADGKAMSNLKVVPLKDDEFNWYGRNEAKTGSEFPTDGGTGQGGGGKGGGDAGKDQGNDKKDAAAAAMRQPLTWAVALPVVATLFI